MDIIDPHQAISYTTRTPEKGEIDILVRSVGLLGLEVVQKLNMEIFREHRVINTFEHDDLLMLVAYIEGKPVGFKVGYRENRFTVPRGAFCQAFGGATWPGSCCMT